ncbi:MAG: methyltransferase domain-containing protein [Anaerolineae bacterium]|nr:methyltransferase domain-containing protein [Anaerolineae bacterium]
MPDPLLVQYGCGLCAPTTWRNFDISPSMRLQRLPIIGRFFKGGRFPDWPANVEYGNIVTGLPVAPNSCRAIYCSHVLEHLALDEFRRALQHTYRYLEPGGVFRFVLPDLEFFIKRYLMSDQPDAALKFVGNTRLGRTTRPRGLRGLLHCALSNSAHLWMWDFKGLSHELQQAGFVDIRRAEFGDSALPYFQDVEDPAKWPNRLGIECMK